MAISLSNLRSSTILQPPRILLYGPPGLGKTTLASEFPSPVLLDIEGGRPAGVLKENVPGFDPSDLKTYDAVMEAITALYQEEHSFQTVIVDTLDRLENLVWFKTCDENQWQSIESPGYGKGYVAADTFWRDLLAGLNALRLERGMTVILIAHSTVERFDDPLAASYSRYDIRLHKRALGIIQDEVDAILFMNQDATTKANDPKAKSGPGTRIRAEGGGNRLVYCEGRPSFTAKNRYGLPSQIIFRPGRGFVELAKALPVPQPEQAEAA